MALLVTMLLTSRARTSISTHALKAPHIRVSTSSMAKASPFPLLSLDLATIALPHQSLK
jgi:hypothetical protein